MSKTLGEMVSDPASYVFSAVVFATVFVAIAAVGLRFLNPTKERLAADPRADSGLRTTMRTITRALSALFMAFLVTVTIASYLEASPHDGSYLVTGVLVIATLMAGNWLYNMDRRLGTTAGDVVLRDDLLRSVHADLAAKIGSAALGPTKVEWSVASPEVHSTDLEALERGRAMLAEGKSLDEICRAIAPDYSGWETGHQQAFQGVVRAALEHGG